jgi:hypothetical protein
MEMNSSNKTFEVKLKRKKLEFPLETLGNYPQDTNSAMPIPRPLKLSNMGLLKSLKYHNFEAKSTQFLEKVQILGLK